MNRPDSAESLILSKAADFGRFVAVEVVNNSSLPLKTKRYFCKNGRVLHPGKDTIDPGARDCTLFAKAWFGPFGSKGVLSFEFKDKKPRCLAILFSNPYNNFLYNQMFALHISESEVSTEKLFKDMFYDGKHLRNFVKAEKHDIHMRQVLDYGLIEVSATMSAECRSILRVKVEDKNNHQ